MENIKDELEIYRTVAGMTGDTLYRFSVKTEEMEIFYGKSAMSKYGSKIKDFLNVLKNTNWLGDTDEIVKEQLIQNFRTGEPGFFTYEIQMMNGIGAYHWNNIIGKTVYDENNLPELIIGKMTDIENHKTKKGITVCDEYHDILTGVLSESGINKSLAEKCERLNGREGACAVFYIKGIRELCAENPEITEEGVLINIAQCIKNVLTYDVEIGRIRFAEFCVFYYGNDVKSRFLSRIEEVVDSIENIKMAGLDINHLTVNSGIYIGPFEYGLEDEILKKARIALSTARFRGNGAAVRYSKEVEELYKNATPGNNPEEKYENVLFDQELIEKSLDIIAETGSVDDAMKLIFSNVGIKYGIDRIYVYETRPGERTVKTTYNWINDKNEYLKGRLLRDRIDTYDELDRLYSNSDIIVIDDVDKYSGEEDYIHKLKSVELKSFVQCSYRGNLSGLGYVGFERYSGHIEWTEKEIKTFKLITKLIFTFLVNVRAYESMLTTQKHYETHDPLTGYYKLDEFMIKAELYIRNHRNDKLAIVYTGLSNFLEVNNKYGYETGDEILKLFASVLSGREDRFIMGCRSNADNFFALVNEYDSMGNKASKATVDGFNKEFQKKSIKICKETNLAINAGIALVNDAAIPVKEYMKIAIEARDRAVKENSISFMPEIK